MWRTRWFALLAASSALAGCGGHTTREPASAKVPEAGKRSAARFVTALVRGDEASASSLLAPDARIGSSFLHDEVTFFRRFNHTSAQLERTNGRTVDFAYTADRHTAGGREHQVGVIAVDIERVESAWRVGRFSAQMLHGDTSSP